MTKRLVKERKWRSEDSLLSRFIVFLLVDFTLQVQSGPTTSSRQRRSAADTTGSQQTRDKRFLRPERFINSQSNCRLLNPASVCAFSSTTQASCRVFTQGKWSTNILLFHSVRIIKTCFVYTSNDLSITSSMFIVLMFMWFILLYKHMKHVFTRMMS